MADFRMDFSPIGELYNTYRQGQQQRQTEQYLQQQGLPGNLNLAQLALQQQAVQQVVRQLHEGRVVKRLLLWLL